MKPLKAFFVAGAAASAILMTSQVIAEKPDRIVMPPPPQFDSKGYPGTTCQPSTLGLATYSQGRICNPAGSTEDLNVFCPIVRDDMEGGDGTVIFVDIAQYVRVVECTASSLGRWYDVVYEETRSVIQPAGEATITLNLEETVNPGYYSLSCILPEDSCIFGYFVLEFENYDYGEMTDYNR